MLMDLVTTEEFFWGNTRPNPCVAATSTDFIEKTLISIMGTFWAAFSGWDVFGIMGILGL